LGFIEFVDEFIWSPLIEEQNKESMHERV
jgi:hypothetical protein